MPVNGPVSAQDSDEDDIDDADRRPQSRIAPPPPKTIGRRRVLIGAVGVAGVAVVGGGAYLLGSDRSKPKPKVDNTFTTFRDPVTGFSLSYPKSWTQLSVASEATIRLLLNAGGGGLDYFEVRVQQTENVDPNNLSDVKAFTDSVLSGAPISVLDQKSIIINGIHGYYYLYTFTDTQSSQKLVHSHYFLYQGHSVFFLVFQALVNDFTGLAVIAGKVVDSFRTFTPTASATTTPSTLKP